MSPKDASSEDVTVPAPKKRRFKLSEIMLEESTKDIIELILGDASNEVIKEIIGINKNKNDNTKRAGIMIIFKIGFKLLNKLNTNLSLVKSISLFINKKKGNISKKILRLEPVIVNKIIAK